MRSCVQCNYTIAVYAYSHTLYSITAVTGDATTQLLNGVPMIGRVDMNKYTNYYLEGTVP